MSLPSQFLPLDPWSASSLLQKAVRRGHTHHAQAAAEAFHRYRGNAIWRRLIITAFEDVGIGDPELVTEVAQAAGEHAVKRCKGPISAELLDLVRRLAEAPKNREADYAISAAVHHPGWTVARAKLGCMSNAERIAIATSPSESVISRSLAAWFASGVNGGSQKIVGRGDLVGLLRGLDGTECLTPFAQAVVSAAQRTREPIVVMVAVLLAVMQENAEHPDVSTAQIPAGPYCRGIPLYTFDKHTRLGKQAIARFVRESSAFRAVLAEHVPEFRALDVAAMAAFYADAVTLARPATWSQSVVLERIGIEADMGKVGCSPIGASQIIDAMRSNLDQLNAIRASLFGQRSIERQAVLPLDLEASK